MDHTTILALEEAQLRAHVERLNAAFESGSAAFYYDALNASHSIDIFRPGPSDEQTEEQQADIEFADSIGQPLVFAFEDAPDAVVKRWGDSHQDGLGDKAVFFVGLLKERFPSGRAEWSRRRDAPGKMFGDIDLSIVYSPDVDGVTVQAHLDSFEPSGVRLAPQVSSRTHLYTSFTHLELKRVLVKLQTLDQLIGDVEKSDAE